ncbi:hypothetical protein DM02DRAFT_633656 [Periconia macrospinosa]|uniref:Mid2 domain-containing protein n=1 Tax=Periconia macrospinosa TaxID=97972 RepID=A0A2V1D8X9_9PLEO|nr:hypothetical protein DM02DRAFT_633656 [Periconia macrospinosa]
MLRKAVLAAALLCAEFAFAEYDQFYFPTKDANNRCHDAGNACPPPSVCAHEALTDTHYCCTTGSKDAVCWINSQTCRGEDKKPATGQLGCPTNASPNGYCCRSDKEQCTLRSGQINICWAVPANPIATVSQDLINNTYSSLLSASPSAKTLTVELAALLSTSSSVPPSSSTSTPSNTPSSSPPAEPLSSTPSTTPSTSPSTSPSPPPTSSSISGGAIGGIVAGAIAGIAAVSGGIFLLLRRRRNNNASPSADHASTSPSSHNKTAEMDGASFVTSQNPYINNGHAYSAVAQNPPGTSAKYAYMAEAGAGNGSWHQPVEMPAEVAQEMDAGHKGSAPPSRNGGPPSSEVK